jgi:hypothetical protein
MFRLVSLSETQFCATIDSINVRILLRESFRSCWGYLAIYSARYNSQCKHLRSNLRNDNESSTNVSAHYIKCYNQLSFRVLAYNW